MQAGVGLLDTDVMPIFIIIALDIVITLRFSINCTAVICSPVVIFSLLREASSETYGPRVYFPSHKFLIYYFAIFYSPIYKPKNAKIFTLPFVQFHLSLLDLTFASNSQGIDNLFITLGASCLIVCAGIDDLCVVSYWIDTLILKLREILISTLLDHPFLFKGKPTQAQEVAERWKAMTAASRLGASLRCSSQAAKNRTS